MSTAGVESPIVNTASKTVLDIRSTRCPISSLVGDVVFHTSIGVNFELNGTNGASQALVEFAGIIVIGIIFGVAIYQSDQSFIKRLSNVALTQCVPPDDKPPTCQP